MYSSTLSLTSGLDGGALLHVSAASPTGKTRYPLCRRLSGTQGLLWTRASISTPPGFDPRTVQPVASRCTDWAIPANLRKVYKHIITGGLSQCCRNDSYTAHFARYFNSFCFLHLCIMALRVSISPLYYSSTSYFQASRSFWHLLKIELQANYKHSTYLLYLHRFHEINVASRCSSVFKQIHLYQVMQFNNHRVLNFYCYAMQARHLSSCILSYNHIGFRMIMITFIFFVMCYQHQISITLQ